MIQKNKELLLKDLSSRLSYGVKVLYLRDFNHDWYDLEAIYISEDEVFITANDTATTLYNIDDYTDRYSKIEEVKPYLFPLSSMTEEQSKIYHELVGGMFGTGVLINLDCLIDFFNRNHLDWRGLIPLGLAEDATNLNIY